MGFRITFKNYGIEWDFMTNENEVEKIIKEFSEHIIEEHFIDYPEEILMKFLNNKT
jgi:hypothetical protein